MIKEELIKYSKDVLEGQIIACEKHKWACKRFLNDLEKEGTEMFPYFFDEEKANRFFKWFESFKHSKGALQGEFIEISKIQKFIFGNIYGWQKADNSRRFKKAYWQVGRKNGKSLSLSIVGSYESIAFGENMAEVYIGATKREQAKIVWNEIKQAIQTSSVLNSKCKIAYGKIQHLKSNSFIVPLSKEDGKKGDGLNPQCAIIDEYMAHPTSEIYDVLVSGMGARKQPLAMIITTAGFDLINPCYSVEYKYCSNILDPNNPINNEEYFVMINELDPTDNIKNPKVWEKANPILCTQNWGMNYLKGELQSALDVPEKMRNFLTKNMNIWVDQKEDGYMNMEKWSKCASEFCIDDFKKQDCICGIDLSATTDLTSVSLEFKLEGKYYVFSHSFMPQDKLQEKIKIDRVPYDLWVKQGYITVTPGAVVDYNFVKKYLDNLRQKVNIKEICFDPWNASQFSQDLMNDGYVCIEIRQGIPTLGEPTKSFREEVYKENVAHNNNPVLSWAVSNAVTRADHNGNIMLDKNKARERIDPIASLINAHTRAISLQNYSNIMCDFIEL